jgi:signal transduction histidine kinase
VYDAYYDINDDTRSMLVYADKERIIQVISNLLDNAIKFTEKGSIHITCEFEKDNYEGNRIQDRVVVKIKDTGSGVSKEVYPKLFTKFVTNSIQGTGLGLYISKSIIEAHGGNIGAQKNEEHRSDGGNGMTFFFSLPLTENKMVPENKEKTKGKDEHG